MPNSYQNRLDAEYDFPWPKLKDWRQKGEIDVIPEQENDRNTAANCKKSDRPKQMTLRRGSSEQAARKKSENQQAQRVHVFPFSCPACGADRLQHVAGLR